jgi:hypothetical protein
MKKVGLLLAMSGAAMAQEWGPPWGKWVPADKQSDKAT